MDFNMMSIDDLAGGCDDKLIRKKTDKQNKWSDLDINRFERPGPVSNMMSIDDLAGGCDEELIRKKTDKQNKWSEFTALDINRFERPGAVSKGNQCPVPNTPRRRSFSQQRGRNRTKEESWTRVQSVDRADPDEDPTLNLLRWAHTDEQLGSSTEELASSQEQWCYHGEPAQDEPDDEDLDYHFG